MSATTEFPEGILSTVGQIAITVDNLDEAKRFYKEVLGLPHLFDAPPKMAFFACGGIRLMISEAQAEGSERFSAAIYFKVADIQKARDTLAQRGLTFEAEPRLIARMPNHELWMAFFRDPSRNLLALMCERPT